VRPTARYNVFRLAGKLFGLALSKMTNKRNILVSINSPKFPVKSEKTPLSYAYLYSVYTKTSNIKLIYYVFQSKIAQLVAPSLGAFVALVTRIVRLQ
jgi:hypothetical protein